MNIALCFCIKNCGKYLNRIFENINSVKGLDGINVYAVFVYDKCTDNSVSLLNNYKDLNPSNTIVKQIDNPSPARTVRIAKARNACLDVVYTELKDIKYHIMIDADDVCAKNWNVKLLNDYLHNFDNDDWDTISFNRDNYYDIWALLFDNFRHHCWGFQRNQGSNIVRTMKTLISKKLSSCKSNSLEVLSAFNGFAIYNTLRFKGFTYDGSIKNALPLFTEQERLDTEAEFKKLGVAAKCNNNPSISSHSFLKPEECCEHIYYHVTAHQAGRKIKISKHKIM
jgi:hypothetical protein